MTTKFLQMNLVKKSLESNRKLSYQQSNDVSSSNLSRSKSGKNVIPETNKSGDTFTNMIDNHNKIVGKKSKEPVNAQGDYDRRASHEFSYFS
jgi:hypothetical protein